VASAPTENSLFDSEEKKVESPTMVKKSRELEVETRTSKSAPEIRVQIVDYTLQLYTTALQQTYGSGCVVLMVTRYVELDFEVPGWFLPLTEQATDLLLQHLVDEPLFSPLFPTYFLYLCSSYGVYFAIIANKTK
jgi:hypothetical protein